jgi:APA family basic amino acid/polyamine antiporter
VPVAISQAKQPALIRGIRRWDLVAVAINGIIGAGIFGLPSKVFALIGPYSLIAFVVCALIVTLIILCFAEVGSRFSETGGPYLYAREALGPIAGFEVGWLMWLARVTAFAANCNLLVDYLGFFWPPATTQFGRAVVITFIVTLLTTINIVGVRDMARVSNVFAIGKLIPIVLFVAVGLFFVDSQQFSFATRPGYHAFSTSVLLLIYAFTGFEMAVIPAGEVHDPRRNMPRAILIATGVVAIIYTSVQLVCVGTLPGLATSQRPLADASSHFLGPAGASIISAGVLVSIAGNLNVVILAASRSLFALAEREELPRLIAATHRNFHTPHVAIVLTTSVMLVLTLWSTFSKQVALSALARLLAYGATCAALIILRRRVGAPEALFKVRAGVAVAILTFLLIVWLFLSSTWFDARDTGIASALGLLIYFAYRWSRVRAR